MGRRYLSRRDFLRLSAVSATGAILGACRPAPTAVPEEPGEPGEKEKVKITMWFHDFNYVEFFTNRANEYAEMHPEYEFEFDIVQISELADKFIAQLVAGTGAPDIVGMEHVWIARLFKGGLAEKGMYDLTPWMDMESADFKDKFLRSELYSWDGKTYGVESALCACVYYYRKDIFDEAGVDPNTFETYDDFIEGGLKLREETGAYMIPAETTRFEAYLMFMLQNDGNLFDDKGNVVFDNPQNIEALQFYYDLAYKHEVAYATPEFWGAGLTAAVKDGTVAGIISADWYSDFVLKASYEELAGKWRVAILPAFEPGGRRTTVWGGTGMGVCQQSEHPDIAWDILKYSYMTKENQVKRYLEIHYFPTMLDALDDPRIVETEDPFFGGQKVGAVIAEVGPGVPMFYTSPYKSEALDILGNEVITPVMAHEKLPEDAFKDAAQTLRELIAAG